MVELTVGYVAGIIAAVVTLVRLWSPNTLVYILSDFLGDKNTAATWSVAGRAIQNSLWPDLLRNDTVLTRGVRWDIRFLVKSIQLVKLLIAIAGIITPLGLYSVVGTGNVVTPRFQYAQDFSPFGMGTPPRSNLTFARLCFSGIGLLSGPAPCPYTNDVVIETGTKAGEFNYSMPYNMTTKFPEILKEIYSSGTTGYTTTISNYFDIEWRQYTTTVVSFVNNGTAFLVGAFRPMESIILNNNIQPVEGLLVDTKVGGLGFRNHTIPVGVGRGGSWEEDVLFIQPETACVNLNLTLEFTVPFNVSTKIAMDVRLVDRGGFVDLNRTYPYYDHDNAQKNPDLRARAYKAAWISNALSMAYMNVTNIANKTSGEKALKYLNSTRGKEFPQTAQASVYYDALGIGPNWGSYLGSSPGSVSPTGDTIYPNPFAISGNDFDDAGLICRGAGMDDVANISNILVGCGLMRGAARRTDGGSPAVFEGGSIWSSELFACASAVKATIKTTTFLLNGTQGLASLSVTGVRPKTYSNNESIPLWGVEATGKTHNEISPLWGLVAPAYEKYPNISVVRQESLYLPGFSDPQFGGFPERATRANIPASQFPGMALTSAYNLEGLGSSSSKPKIDYTGFANMALYARWQNLSSDAESAASIVNLIWTDVAAATIVGTKGVLGPGNTGDDVLQLTVRPLVNQIKYHWLFSIPAFLIALICIVIGSFAFLTCVYRRHNLIKMRKHLHQTAAGRILTSFIYPEYTNLDTSSHAWSQAVGRNVIDLGGDNPLMTLLAKNNSHKGGVVVQETRMMAEDRVSEGDRFLVPRTPSPYGGHSPQFAPPPHQNKPHVYHG